MPAVLQPLNTPPPGREDPLEYLRCSAVARYRKGQKIYDDAQPANGLYLIVDGVVEVAAPATDGVDIVLALYGADEFFGESALIGPTSSERATALRDTSVMRWSAVEIEAGILEQPRLGLALMQMVIARNIDFRQRITSFAGDSIGQRLARSLLRLAERLGAKDEDGRITMLPLTHELLAHYVGTSREVVTNYMAQFRRDGYVAYSRRGIRLDHRAMSQWLQGIVPA